MDNRHCILILDDDAQVRLWLKTLLEDAGFAVCAVARGDELQAHLATQPCSLVILDLKLRGEDGMTVARELRQKSAVPIIMISGQGDETDRVLGLEMAVDDFINKPFSGRELLARVRALLRRSTELSPPRQPGEAGGVRYSFGDWVLDMGKRVLIRQGCEPCSLTRGEFAILAAMVQHPSRVWSRDQLLEHTRGIEIDVYDRTIDVLILRLRRKIEPNPRLPAYIRTERGEGYLFASPVTRL
ncbi:response regulator transcription factor [Silvimonas sp.]|uniref:response regulator transcription factor n=1 Tax=Silvimonas sp. TaxID=2650811 RepID=UPI0028474EBF|nr:response regulator transcription factor [Silvimonas sp.]MDR3429331.1 response regulator transcription factor [Silvimonas sp.]